jgi:hypothetical protein
MGYAGLTVAITSFSSTTQPHRCMAASIGATSARLICFGGKSTQSRWRRALDISMVVGAGVVVWSMMPA